MIAYVSAEGARGVILREGRFHGVLLDSEQGFVLNQMQLRSFFLHALDVEMIECSSEKDLRKVVEVHWKQDRSFKLVLIAFDSKWRRETRVDAAKCVEELLGEQECHSFVLSHLYSAPLPSACDVNEVSDLLADADAPVLEEIFDTLVVRQPEIKNCVDAWNQLPIEVFEGESEKAAMRARIVRTGAFYRFAAFDTGSNDSLFRILADPVIAGQAAKGREIVSRWASKYKEMPSRPKFEFQSDGERWLSARHDGGAGGQVGFEVFQRVKKQKATIKAEYSAGNDDKADALVELLIKDQQAESSDEHLAKSLCDLAVFCKSLGDLGRHLRFSLRATEEAPSDAWAFIQLGSAYSAKCDFPRALDCFERAEILGDGRTSLIGRAEAFKHMGQREIALQMLDRCILENPNDDIAKGARAALLAHFGEFSESLDAYNELIKNQLGNAYFFGGRAGVFNDLGRREDALRDQEMAVHLAGDEPVPYCAKAEMLREYGRFSEALNALKIPHKRPHYALLLDSVRSRIYRDMGDFIASEKVLRSIHEAYPHDVMSRVALADLYRKKGLLSEALALYQEIERDFPDSRFGRNGMAAAYAALGRFEEALVYLPVRGASTKSDWAAQHIRAMIDIKLNRWLEAKAALVDGIEACPWVQQKPYFSTGLASLNLKQGYIKAAVDAIKISELWITPATSTAIDMVSAHISLVVGKRSSFEYSPRASIPLVELYVQKLKAAAIEGANDAVISSQLFELEWKAQLCFAA